MNYDPKLREAMFHIEEICKRYEIAGFINLHSRTHGEFKFIWPIWSVVQNVYNENSKGLHIKYKNGVDCKKNLEATVGCLLEMEKMAGISFIGLEELNSALKKKIQIEHWSGPINNDGRGDA